MGMGGKAETASKERSAVHDQLLDKFIYTLLIIRSEHRFVLFSILIRLVNRCGVARTPRRQFTILCILFSPTSWLYILGGVKLPSLRINEMDL